MKDGTPLPSALSGNTIERLVRIDEALIYLVNGALEYLCDREPLEQTGTLTPEDAKLALSDMFWVYFTEQPVQAIYPHSFYGSIHEAKKVTGTTLTQTFLSGGIYAGYVEITPGAINNEIAWDVFIDSGIWRFSVLATTNNSSGIVMAKIDGVDISSNDWYTGSVGANVENEYPVDVTITDPGNHTLSFKVTGKNASSSNYLFKPQAVYGRWISAL